MSAPPSRPEQAGLAVSLPVVFAGGALIVLMVFAALGVDGAVWLVAAALGIGAVVTGAAEIREGDRGAALVSAVVGAAVAVMVLVWGIAG